MSKLKNEDKAFKMDFSLVNDTDDNENRINKSTHRDYIDRLTDFSLNGISITPYNGRFYQYKNNRHAVLPLVYLSPWSPRGRSSF